jgi:FMN phosphatase YigB (HAD superfamily)
MSIRAVLLDLGNVLVFHDNALLMRRLGERAGKSGEALAAALPADTWDRLNRGLLTGEGLRAELARLGVPLAEAAFRELWSSHFTLHTEVFPVVERLIGRVKLVLVSNTNALHMEWVRARVPLLDRFDALVLSHELGRAKPDPDIYREALRRADVAPAEACFFDDIPEYVEAARALGIRAELFSTAGEFARQLAALGL